MGKSTWRLNFITRSVMSKIFKESTGVKLKKKKAIIMHKESTVPNSLIRNIFYIHKGLKYRELKIYYYHVGFKFGEFVLTRKPHFFKKKNKSKSNRY